MNILLFMFHYLIALSYIWLPEKIMAYYVIAVIVYLYLIYGKLNESNVYRDVHSFFIGYLSVWLIEILPIGNQENLNFTIILMVYIYILYKEKYNEDIEVKREKEVVKRMIYIVVIPFSAFLSVLYMLQEEKLAFLIYYAFLFYGVYHSRWLMKSKAFLGFSILNVSILMFYLFEYVSVNIYEKIFYLLLFIVAALYNPKKIPIRG